MITDSIALGFIFHMHFFCINDKKIMRCNRMMQSTTKLRKHEEKYLCAFMHFLFFFTLKNFFCTQMTSNQVNVSKPGKFIRSSLPKKYIIDGKTHIMIISIFVFLLLRAWCREDRLRLRCLKLSKLLNGKDTCNVFKRLDLHTADIFRYESVWHFMLYIYKW